MRPLRIALAAAPLVAWSVGSGARDVLPDIAYHDNTTESGHLANGELALAFEIRRGTWRLNGPERPGTPVLAFAEPGKALSLPGPMIRVPVGTRLNVTVTNTTDSVLVLRGISTNPDDSLLLAPGATGTARGDAPEPGNRFYHLGYRGNTATTRRADDGHLAGALVVEAPGQRAKREHVLVITNSFHFRDSTGRLTREREIFVFNGRAWPRTQRYEGAVGEEMRFRVLNATEDGHPMHLHGSFFRVDARGIGTGDSIYSKDQQRMVVTEYMRPGTTMTMSWTPDRPGGWLMHCHLTFHVTSNIGFGEDSLSGEEAVQHELHGHGGASPDDHVEKAMGGLMTLIEVPPPPGWRLERTSRRLVQFEIPSDSIAGDIAPLFAPTIRDAAGVAPPLAPRGPGGALILTQHEPTTVRVVNRSNAPTAIHWHGMELESLFDGVVGLGGTPGQRTTAVAPRDSFDAHMTPPRAGTFIYHTHFMEVKQGAFGLYGAMIILPPGERLDPERDRYYLAGPTTGSPSLNGGRTLPPGTVEVGAVQRLRLINVTAANPALRFRLAKADSSLWEWTTHAKDGLDLPPHQRRTVLAEQMVSMGETYDMTFVPERGAVYRVELRSGGGRLIGSQTLQAVGPR
jgi:manganese oxidase